MSYKGFGKIVNDALLFREKYSVSNHISQETRVPNHASTRTMNRYRFHEESTIQIRRPFQWYSRAEILRFRDDAFLLAEFRE